MMNHKGIVPRTASPDGNLRSCQMCQPSKLRSQTSTLASTTCTRRTAFISTSIAFTPSWFTKVASTLVTTGHMCKITGKNHSYGTVRRKSTWGILRLLVKSKLQSHALTGNGSIGRRCLLVLTDNYSLCYIQT